MIVGNTDSNGCLDTDAFQKAMLVYRNTPQPDTQISPAMCVFGRPIRSPVPILPGKYQPHPTWSDTLQKREEALRLRHLKIAERLAVGTRPLPPLKVGDHFRIQNQVGANPRKWDRTGTVIEVKQFDQYGVKVDGSGRVTLRNRKFLRRFIPVMPRIPSYHTPSFSTQTPYPSSHLNSHSFPLPSYSSSVPSPQPSLSSGMSKTAVNMTVKRDEQQPIAVGTSAPTQLDDLWQRTVGTSAPTQLDDCLPTTVGTSAPAYTHPDGGSTQRIVTPTGPVKPTASITQPVQVSLSGQTVQPTQNVQQPNETGRPRRKTRQPLYLKDYALCIKDS